MTNLEDPVRLVSSAEDSLLRDALRAGESELGTSDQLAIVAAKLGPILGGGGIGGAGAAGGAGGASGAAKATGILGGTTAKIVGALGIGAVVSLSAGYAAVSSHGNDAPTVSAPMSASPVATLRVESASPEPVAEVPSTIPSARSIHSLPNVKPSATSSSAPAESEVHALQRAMDALQSNPAVALSICNEQAKRPNALNDEEREVIAIDALTRLGKSDDAVARARRFRKAHPSSGHLGRIEVLVGRNF